MVRRIFNAILLVGGAGPIGWVLARWDLDARRSAAVGFLLLIGVVLNVTGLFRRNLALSRWLRILAAVMALLVLVSVVAIRAVVWQQLEATSPGNLAGREPLVRMLQGTFCLAWALVYVILSVAVLPPRAKVSPAW